MLSKTGANSNTESNTGRGSFRPLQTGQAVAGCSGKRAAAKHTATHPRGTGDRAATEAGRFPAGAGRAERARL